MFGNIANRLKAHMREELLAKLKQEGTCTVPGIGVFVWTRPPHEGVPGYLHFTPEPAFLDELKSDI